MNDLAELTKFATRYAEAWCSQDPEKVAAFFAERGSISINDGLIAESKGHFDAVDYERQLKRK